MSTDTRAKGAYEYAEVILMHTSLEVHLFEQLHLLKAEIDEGVASLATLQTSWDVNKEHQLSVQNALKVQAVQAQQEATHQGRAWCWRMRDGSPQL